LPSPTTPYLTKELILAYMRAFAAGDTNSQIAA